MVKSEEWGKGKGKGKGEGGFIDYCLRGRRPIIIIIGQIDLSLDQLLFKLAGVVFCATNLLIIF